MKGKLKIFFSIIRMKKEIKFHKKEKEEKEIKISKINEELSSLQEK